MIITASKNSRSRWSNAPRCQRCNKPLHRNRHLAAAHRRPAYGYKGRGNFCTARCAYWYAENAVERGIAPTHAFDFKDTYP